MTPNDVLKHDIGLVQLVDPTEVKRVIFSLIMLSMFFFLLSLSGSFVIMQAPPVIVFSSGCAGLAG